MAWSLSSWLMFTRVFQLLGALAAAGLNGFLTAWIYTKRLGLTQGMVVLELLICILLVYTTLAMIIQHTGKRSKRKGWLVCFIILDVCFCTADLAIVSLLARAGLPDHCHGLTRADVTFDEINDTPYEGNYITPGFSDESDGQKGRLDRFCGYERSFFIIAVTLVFTYIITIVLGSLGIYETSHTKNTKVGELLDSLERAKGDNVNLKLLDSATSPLEREPRQSMPAPPSEGIITRTASLRSTLTSLTSSTTGQRPYAIPRRPIPQPTPPLPPRRLSLPKPGSAPSQGMGAGFVPVPLDEDSAEAALVADGMQHSRGTTPSQHQHQHQHQHQRHLAFDDSDAALVADGLQHQPHRSHRRGASGSIPQGMPMLLEEEQTAESALVSDGMRPFEPMLPPYEPSTSRMAGHGPESNDMRLSEYVKGGTQAQDMKDSGRY